MKKSLSAVMLVTFIISSIFLFQYGKTKKMHQVVPGAIEDNVWCMSVAISDLCYNLNEGYVFYADVCDKLNEMGMTKYEKYLEPLNLTFGPNICDPVLMNKALHEACTLKINKDHRSLLKKHIIPIRATDIGYSKFFKWSYQIFGIHVSSPYYFFFVLFAIGSLAYFIAFFPSPLYLLLPLFFNGIFYYCMKFMGICDPIFNFRTLTFLAMIPTAHLILSILIPPLIEKRTNLIILIVQALMICFVITVRSSSIWMLLAVALPCMQKALYFLYQKKKENSYRDLASLVFNKLKEHKAVITLLAIPLAIGIYFKSYKSLMLVSSFGFRLIKRQHLSWNDFFMSAAIVSVIVIIFMYFAAISLKNRGKLFKISILSLSLFVLFIVPALAFCSKEHPDFLSVSYKYYKILHLFVFVGSIVFVMFVCKGILNKYPTAKNIFLDTKRYFLQSSYAPALVMFLAFFSYKAFLAYEYHPAYYLNDCMPRHLVYHNAFIGLSSHPKIYRDVFERGKPGGDTVSWCAARAYFLKSKEKKGKPFPTQWYDSPFTKDVKMKLHDKAIRTVYLKFIFKHPIYTIQAHLYKVKNMYEALKNLLILSKNFYLYSALALIIVLVILSSFGIQVLQCLQAFSKATLYMAVCSVLPYLYAMNQYGHEDYGIIVATAIYFGAIYLSYHLLKLEKAQKTSPIKSV